MIPRPKSPARPTRLDGNTDITNHALSSPRWVILFAGRAGIPHCGQRCADGDPDAGRHLVRADARELTFGKNLDADDRNRNIDSTTRGLEVTRRPDEIGAGTLDIDTAAPLPPNPESRYGD